MSPALISFCALPEMAQGTFDLFLSRPPAQLFDDVRHFLVGRWGDAHFVESLVGAVLRVLVQVDAVVLHPVEVVLAVQHFDGHAVELGHCQPVLSLFVEPSRGCSSIRPKT